MKREPGLEVNTRWQKRSGDFVGSYMRRTAHPRGARISLHKWMIVAELFQCLADGGGKQAGNRCMASRHLLECFPTSSE